MASTAAPLRHSTAGVASPMAAEERERLLAAREAVWRAWFANDQPALRSLVPEDVVAINAGEEAWADFAAVMASARDFAAGGSRLVRLEFPRTIVQDYGNVAVLYSTYVFEVEAPSGRTVSSGRASEIFVKRDERWVNPGWHLDSGR